MDALTSVLDGTGGEALLSKQVIDTETKVYMYISHLLCHARSEKDPADKPQLVVAKQMIRRI